MAKSRLPQESTSQTIGHRAVQALRANWPQDWRDTPLTGDSDVGLDMQIQTVSGNRYQHTFFAQIKGSTTKSTSADGSYVSVALKVSTANYLRRSAAPVMLIFADLSSDPNPKTAPVYYVWLDAQLSTGLDAIQASGSRQNQLTIRIPTSQVVSQSLDVSSELDEAMQRRESLLALQRAVARTSLEDSRVNPVRRIAENIDQRGSLYLESTLGESDVPWADAAMGSNAWKIRQLNDAIVDGDVGEAARLAAQLETVTLRDDKERAELQYQLGRLDGLRGSYNDAVQHYRAALRIAPTGVRYICALIEARIHLEEYEAVASEMLRELGDSKIANEPRIVAMRARLLVILDRRDEAKGLLDGLAPRHSIFERMLMATLEENLDAVSALLEEAEGIDLQKHTRLSLRILAARARFQDTFKSRSKGVIPASGPPNVDAAKLMACWDVLSQLASDLRANNWPINSELLIEVLAPIAICMGKANEALVLVDEFLKERPQFARLQSFRMKLAVFANKFEIALKAAALLPEVDERPVHEVIIRYEMGDFSGAVAPVDQLLKVPLSLDSLAAEALLICAHCAHRTYNKAAGEKCLARMREAENGDILEILYRFIVASDGGKESRRRGVQDLRTAYEQHAEDSQIQDHLVTALWPHQESDATLVLEIADKIRVRRSLFAREVAHVARSLNALGRPREAIAELEGALARLPGDVEITSLLALMCEEVGDTSRALGLLDEVLRSEASIPEFARSTYINLAARSGLAEQALRQFTARLSEAKDDESKRDILRAMFSLELYRGADASRLTWLAFSYGALADRNDEVQEGLFLQMVLMGGTGSKERLPEADQLEFNSRVQAYIEKFPDSNYFSAIELPEKFDAVALKEILRKKRGYTLEQVATIEVLQAKLSRGDLLVPYSWRPRFLLPQVANIAHLWEFTKRTSNSERAYSLPMAPKIREGKDLRGKGIVPLLDLPTLLLITELDLWEATLRLFGVIAISKMTLLRIQTDASPLGFTTDTLLRLRNAIASDIEKIEQPGKVTDRWENYRDGGLEEYKEILGDTRFALFSDDHLARIVVLGDDKAADGITTPDVIESVERAGWLSRREVAERYARLVSWNVGGAPIYYRHLLAAIPASVDDVSTVNEKVNILFEDKIFRPLVDAAWGYDKPYDDLVRHVAAVLAQMVNDSPERIDEKLLSAIFGLWLDKVRIRPDIRIRPEQHVAHVFLRAYMYLADNGAGFRQMWNAYGSVIERLHGSRMDEERERQGFRLVGEAIAAAVNENSKLLENIDGVLARFRAGLKAGTSDEGHFLAGYYETRAAAATKTRGKDDRQR